MIYLSSFRLSKRKVNNPNIYPYNVFRDKYIEPFVFRPITVLYGNNGSGKSTLLNMIAGLDSQTKGHIILNNKEITGPGPERAVVFQNHSLLPWLTVYQNIEMAVKKVLSFLVSPE